MSINLAVRDELRIRRIREGMVEANLEALVVALPANVLLLSGYWPVVGTSIAVISSDGRLELLVPTDEEHLARDGWADEIRTFSPGSLDDLHTVLDAVRSPLREVVRRCARDGRVGFESGRMNEVVSYASMFLYGSSMRRLLEEAVSPGRLQVADRLLERLGAIKTPHEIEALRIACEVARFAYDGTRLQAGMSETDVAAGIRGLVLTRGTGYRGVTRSEAFAFCMSGPNSARAAGSFAFCTSRRLERGDLVMIHCNSYADGYWTDITRTYCLGHLRSKQRFFRAVLDARAAALAAIRPGARGADVDAAARNVLREAGLGHLCPHPIGHGVGFAAIDSTAPPRIHPLSEDVLQEGMVFNVEPAVYVEGEGGLRHCDIVAVTGDRHEVLTAFQDGIDALALP